MKKIWMYTAGIVSMGLFAIACNQQSHDTSDQAADDHGAGNDTESVVVDRFADLQVLRYDVPGFDKLPLERKLLIYHLSEAALAGGDIIDGQNYPRNLRIRKAQEEKYTTTTGHEESVAVQDIEYLLQHC